MDDGSLARDGQQERVEPKVMAVLAYLASRRGEVASKEEILAAVWPDAVVEEGALARCVSELRRVLGDDPKKPRYIETLPRRGYRLVAEVEPFTGPLRSASSRGPVIAGFLAVAGLLVGLALWWSAHDDRGEPVPGAPNRPTKQYKSQV